MSSQAVRIERVYRPSPELTEGLLRLLPQLSTNTPEELEGALAAVLACATNRLLIAWDERGRIVGTLTLVVFPMLTGMRGWIEDVVVDADSRGRGIASSLVLEAVRLAEDERARTSDLTSRRSRVDANRLYERLGFTPRDSNVYRFRGKQE